MKTPCSQCGSTNTILVNHDHDDPFHCEKCGCDFDPDFFHCEDCGCDFDPEGDTEETEDDGQPSDLQENADFAQDDCFEPDCDGE